MVVSESFVDFSSSVSRSLSSTSASSEPPLEASSFSVSPIQPQSPSSSTARPTSCLRSTCSFPLSPRIDSSILRFSSTLSPSTSEQVDENRHILVDTQKRELAREKMQGVGASYESELRERMDERSPQAETDPWSPNRFSSLNEQQQQIDNGGGSATSFDFAHRGSDGGGGGGGEGHERARFDHLSTSSVPQHFASSFPFGRSTYPTPYQSTPYYHDPQPHLSYEQSSTHYPSSIAMSRGHPLPNYPNYAQNPVFPSMMPPVPYRYGATEQQQAMYSPTDLPASLDHVQSPAISSQFSPSNSFSHPPLPLPFDGHSPSQPPSSDLNAYSWSTLPEYRSSNQEEESFSSVPSIASDRRSSITSIASNDSSYAYEYYQSSTSPAERFHENDSPFATVNHLNLANFAEEVSLSTSLPSNSPIHLDSINPSFDESRRFSWPLANYQVPQHSSLSSFNQRRFSMIDTPSTVSQLVESTIGKYAEGIGGSDLDAEGEVDSEEFRGAQTLISINPSPRSTPQDLIQDEAYNTTSTNRLPPLAQVNLSRRTSKKRAAVRTPSPELGGSGSETFEGWGQVVHGSEGGNDRVSGATGYRSEGIGGFSESIESENGEFGSKAGMENRTGRMTTRNKSATNESKNTTQIQAAPSRQSSLTKKPSLNKNKIIVQIPSSRVADWTSKTQFFSSYTELNGVIDTKGNSVDIATSINNPSSFSHDTEIDCWLGYRRNFISFSITVTLPSSLSSYHTSTSSSPIAHLEVLLTSTTSPGGYDVELLQFDTSRSLSKATRVGSQQLVPSTTCKVLPKGGDTSSLNPTTCSTNFNRIQYRASTANHPAADPGAQDSRFVMVVTLSSVHEDGSQTTLGSWGSAKLVIRGRSPGSFDKSKKTKGETGAGAGAGPGQKKRKKLSKGREEDMQVEAEEEEVESNEGQSAAQ